MGENCLANLTSLLDSVEHQGCQNDRGVLIEAPLPHHSFTRNLFTWVKRTTSSPVHLGHFLSVFQAPFASMTCGTLQSHTSLNTEVWNAASLSHQSGDSPTPQEFQKNPGTVPSPGLKGWGVGGESYSCVILVESHRGFSHFWVNDQRSKVEKQRKPFKSSCASSKELLRLR